MPSNTDTLFIYSDPNSPLHVGTDPTVPQSLPFSGSHQEQVHLGSDNELSASHQSSKTPEYRTNPNSQQHFEVVITSQPRRASPEPSPYVSPRPHHRTCNSVQPTQKPKALTGRKQ